MIRKSFASNFPSITPCKVKSFKEFKDKEYDRLADFLREHLDIEKIYQIMQEHEESKGQ